jgi:hypothetical protein
MMVRQYHDFVQATIEPGVWNDRWSGRERDWYDPGDRWLRFLAVRWIVSPRPAPFPPRFGREGLRYLAAGEPGSSRAGREDGPETVRLAPSEELRLTLRVPDRSPALVLEPALEGDARLEATVREPEFGTVLRTVWPRSGDAEAETVRAELGPWRGRRVLLHLAAAPVEELTRTDATLVLSGLRLGRDPLPFDGLVRHIPWEGPRPLLVRGPPGGDAMLALPAFGHAELKLQVPEEEAELELRVRAAGPAGTPRIALLIAIAGEAREHVLWSGSRTDATSRVEADLSPWAGREVELALRAAGGDGSGPALARGVEVRTDAAQTLVPVHRTGPYVYRNDAALPRAFVVHRAEVARSDAEGLERLRAPDFDPARTVLLSDPVPAERLAPAVREGSRSVARIAREAADEVEVEATLDAPGFLVLSDVHYPGWRVEVDGARAPLHRANHAFRAVWLPAGRHVARFRYVCGPWRLGLALAGATAALVALAAVRGVRSPRGT